MSDVVRITSREFRRMLETSRTEDARVAELECREALLTACVLAEGAYTSAYESSENIATDHYCEAKRMEFLRARNKLDDAGFPWTDGDR